MLRDYLDSSANPYVVLTDDPTCSPLPVLYEMLRRGRTRGSSLVVTFRPLDIGQAEHASGVDVIDFSGCVPGFTAEPEYSLVHDAVAQTSYTDIYLYGIESVPFVRHLLRTFNGRLVVVSSLPAFLPPTLSASLVRIDTYPRSFITDISQAYLARTDSQKFWDLFENAPRGYRDVTASDLAVRITSRKATGGAKGMERAIEKFPRGEPMDVPMPTHAVDATSAGVMDVPFNLNLTDDQRRRRDAVPLPYVHEGEGIDLGDEDEEEDE